MNKCLKKVGKPLLFVCAALALVLYLVACSSEPDVVEVEVTRVVTETEIVEVEGEPVEVEVTRVVTETVIETVEVEAESEDEPEPPSATGSEDDSGPLPPDPENGPKVSSRGGSTIAESVAIAEITWGTAVTSRANPVNASHTEDATFTTVAVILDATEWQKQCQLTLISNKKKCS